MLASVAALGNKFLNTPTTTSTDLSNGSTTDAVTDPSPLEKMYYKLFPPGSYRDSIIQEILDNQSFHERVEELMSQPIFFRPNDVLHGEASRLPIDQLQLQFESKVSSTGGYYLYPQEGIVALDELVRRSSTCSFCSFCDGRTISMTDYQNVVQSSAVVSCISNFPSFDNLKRHLKDPRSIDQHAGYALVCLFDKAHALEVVKVESGTCNIGLARRFVSFPVLHSKVALFLYSHPILFLCKLRLIAVM